jgi:hypothetical protein
MDRRWLLIAATMFAGCSQPAKTEPEFEPPKEVSTDFGRLRSVLEGIRRPGERVLYAGLPSEFWEPQLRELEVSRNRTVRLQGYLFYDARLELTAEDAERVTTLLSSERSFQRRRGAKTCSGYEPDYCIEWKSSDATTRILICLDCGEVKIFGPRTDLYCDLSSESNQKLDQWLKPYQKRPPAAESG